MPRTMAKFNQADIARALRAAQSVDPRLGVRLTKAGDIVIQQGSGGGKESGIDDGQEIRL